MASLKQIIQIIFDIIKQCYSLPLGNLTLWLKSRGLYDRKSTESSNVVVLSSSRTAPHLLLSADSVEIRGIVQTVDSGHNHVFLQTTRSVQRWRLPHFSRLPTQKKAISIDLHVFGPSPIYTCCEQEYRSGAGLADE